MKSKLNPYISFNGNAREALEFYKAALGGNLATSTFAEGGMSEHYPNETEKLMHGQLDTESGMTIMVSDTPSDVEYKPGTNISLSLSGDNEDELRGYWDKLSVGGTISQPLVKAPWGDTFGMFADKFGIDWMVNIAGKKRAAS